MTTSHPFELTAGDYELYLTMLAKGKVDRMSELQRVIRVRPEDRDFLGTYRPKTSAETARNLRFHFDPDLDCYVSTLAAGWKASAATLQS